MARYTKEEKKMSSGCSKQMSLSFNTDTKVLLTHHNEKQFKTRLHTQLPVKWRGGGRERESRKYPESLRFPPLQNVNSRLYA